ncbi:MAG: DUF2726 domain-containing protein [Aquisalimonadaceae bacterium]
MIETVELILVLAVLGFAVLLLLLLVLIRRLRRRKPAAISQVQVRPPMDRPRRVFHRTLRQALPRHVILAQVGYSRFLAPEGLSARRSEKINAELETMVADYLVCSDGLDVVAVVALDNSAGNAQERLLDSAALPLIRWRTSNLPTTQGIRETIQDLESLTSLNRRDISQPPVDDTAARREPSLGGNIELGSGHGRQEPKL